MFFSRPQFGAKISQQRLEFTRFIETLTGEHTAAAVCLQAKL